VVSFGEIQKANGRNRRLWAQELQQDVLFLKQGALASSVAC
jgi:hypothetical protein